jgi:hypothetical protein
MYDLITDMWYKKYAFHYFVSFYLMNRAKSEYLAHLCPHIWPEREIWPVILRKNKIKDVENKPARRIKLIKD